MISELSTAATDRVVCELCERAFDGIVHLIDHYEIAHRKQSYDAVRG